VAARKNPASATTITVRQNFLAALFRASTFIGQKQFECWHHCSAKQF